MAIDSRRKRASIACLGLAFLGPSIVPDGSLSAPDRQVVANSYYGITAATGKTIGGTGQLEAFTSSGTLAVQTNHTIGASSALEAFTSSGTLVVVVPKTIGDSSQLEAFGATGGITVVSATPGVPPTPAPDGKIGSAKAGANYYDKAARRRQQALQDENDFLEIVKIALPEIVKYLK